jgi:hypothetical protein
MPGSKLAIELGLTSQAPTPAPVPAVLGITEGDMIRAEGDKDVFIVNSVGFKRLFLNPIIFNLYAHLGGYGKVKIVTDAVRDAYITSGYFTNCSTRDGGVYAVEVTAEDAGVLHHVALTGEEVLAQDPDFFKKVFCINGLEFNWYPKSSVPYTALDQVPAYTPRHRPELR